MSVAATRKEMARTERILPGLWRLRLPLPWPGVPHVNAWIAAAGDGVVLFDTGYSGADGMRQLELGLAQAGFAIEDVSLLVCTHAHTDHYGLAGPVADAAGCEVWIHPAWEHVRALAEDPDKALDRRIAVARHSGVPDEVLEEYERNRRGQETGIARAIPPDRELVSGVEVETDLGSWQVHETPGHAPSHVVLFEPERGLLLSGDHLLGRISLFFDYGHTPDPVAEFLGGLDVVEGLDAKLCLSGHGRPFRDVAAKVAANRVEVDKHLDRIRESLAAGPKTAFETVPDLFGPESLTPANAAWGLQLALAYLDHLALRGEIEATEGSDPRLWQLPA